MKKILLIIFAMSLHTDGHSVITEQLLVMRGLNPATTRVAPADAGFIDPQGNEYLDLESTDAISQETFREIIAENRAQNRPTVLARVEIAQPNGAAQHRFYEAPPLVQSLTLNNAFQVWRNPLDPVSGQVIDAITLLGITQNNEVIAGRSKSLVPGAAVPLIFVASTMPFTDDWMRDALTPSAPAQE